MPCYFDRAWCLLSFPCQGAARCVTTACARCVSDEHIERAQQLNLDFSMSDFSDGPWCAYSTTQAAPAPCGEGLGG